ncbi:hypothetical protein C8Q73DRAFT_840311 [Cubamyces lactineus]|nr:hypothetical protein C8Q73DRAFT_840311 [Cubamyces lactineus]
MKIERTEGAAQLWVHARDVRSGEPPPAEARETKDVSSKQQDTERSYHAASGHPPAITAGSALEVPGVVAPWEFGQHLDVYLLRDAILLANGRTRRGHAVLMFEDATDVLPQMLNPSPGLPPTPGAGGIAITVTKTTHTHSSPEPDDSDHDNNSIRVNSIVQATRPGTPIATTHSDCPPNSPRTRPVTVEEVEDVEGESHPIFTTAADAQYALQKLEGLVSAWMKKMDVDDGPTWTVVRESEEVTMGDEDGQDNGGTSREDRQTGAPTGDGTLSITPLTTPEAASPILSPLDLNTTILEARQERALPTFEIPDVPYDLRPRPVPRKRYLESPPPREPIKKPRRRGAGRARPQLALQAAERARLVSLLDVPARLWTRSERRFLRTSMRSMRRAIQGGIGHGEVLTTDSDENHDENAREPPQWESAMDNHINSFRARL